MSDTSNPPSIRDIAEIAGFEIVGRVTLKHKKSGKIFR